MRLSMRSLGIRSFIAFAPPLCGRKLGLGKEILLNIFGKQPFFPSKNRSESGIIRMYEYKTCEIPLLRCPDSTIRTSTPTMYSLQANVDAPAQEARPPEASHASGASPQGPVERIYAPSAHRAADTVVLGDRSLSISTSVGSLC